MKLALAIVAFCFMFAPRADAWGENHCWWDGREMHCRSPWVWHQRREWNPEYERDREYIHRHNPEWNYPQR